MEKTLDPIEVLSRAEFEKASGRFHTTAAWIAIIFDPLFAFTDYINIPAHWGGLLILRCTVSILCLATLVAQKRFRLPSYVIVIVPFTLISLQNAYTYSLIDAEDLVGHNLNYIALLIGAAMFLAWEWFYSVIAIALSCVATCYFVYVNPQISADRFFLEGGLLLSTVGIFMTVLIQTRYRLTMKEIRARVALQLSKEEIQTQNEALHRQEQTIRRINENLEQIVKERTAELQKKNEALEQAAFINAHKLRSPVASILGLMHLVKKAEMPDGTRELMDHLNASTERLDEIVGSITRTIEEADRT